MDSPPDEPLAPASKPARFSLGSLGLKAALWVIGLFIVELFIAVYVRDRWVRPYGGDVLAALFVYVGFRVFSRRASSLRLAVAAFATGACVEIFQACRLPMRLGLTQYTVLRVAIGTTFQWGDLLAYAMGATLGWILDEKTHSIR